MKYTRKNKRNKNKKNKSRKGGSEETQSSIQEILDTYNKLLQKKMY